MTIQDCPTCGGTHIGHRQCSYIKAPCVVCGTDTIMACSDCAIDSGGKTSVHICGNGDCRRAHEAEKHPAQATI